MPSPSETAIIVTIDLLLFLSTFLHASLMNIFMQSPHVLKFFKRKHSLVHETIDLHDEIMKHRLVSFFLQRLHLPPERIISVPDVLDLREAQDPDEFSLFVVELFAERREIALPDPYDLFPPDHRSL